MWRTICLIQAFASISDPFQLSILNICFSLCGCGGRGGVGGVCIGHNCDSVHGRYVSGHVSRFHRDVCSVQKIQTRVGVYEVLKDH